MILESRTLSDAGLREFMVRNLGHPLDLWPPSRWDQDLLTLAAFYYNPDLAAARAHWSVQQAGERTAGERPNPVLTVTPDYATNAPPGVSAWLPAAALDVTIEIAGKRGHRIEQARRLSESARWNIWTTAWEVRFEVRTSLLDAADAQQREELLKEQVTVQEHIDALLEKRRLAGAVAGSDLVLFRTQLAKTRLDLQAARAQRIDAQARVALAVGIPMSALNGVPIGFNFNQTEAADLTSEEAHRHAVQGRSDLLSALADYAAAQSALQLEIARQYPDVHLGPGYQWDQGQNDWSLGLALELPVLNWHRGPIAEAEARRGEAAARFTAFQANVINEVDAAVTAVQAERQGSQAAEALLAVHRDRLQAMQAQVDAGAGDALDLATAQFEFTAAEALALEACGGEQRALGVLERAVQRPLGAPDQAHALQRQLESTQRSPQ